MSKAASRSATARAIEPEESSDAAATAVVRSMGLGVSEAGWRDLASECDDGAGEPMAQPRVTLALSPREELKLHQFHQARFFSTKTRLSRATEQRVKVEPPSQTVPEWWELTRGITLHDWQQRCVDAWFTHGKRGIIKVVTGAGKTILALAIAERLQQTDMHELRVAVVVPTVVLLEQWYEELVVRSNLPEGTVGLLGGGHEGTFSEETRILVCVLNSAAAKLAAVVERTGIARQLLLVVDECHRAGAAEMQRVFQTTRAYSLGLSATPERDEDPAVEGDDDAPPSGELRRPTVFEETVLGRELGPVIFEMSYAEAINLGVLPPFRVIHYGLSLRPAERARYDRLTREISDLKSDLEAVGRRGVDLLRWCRSRAAANNPKAGRLVGLISDRKQMLYRMTERSAAVLAILRDAFARDPACKAILFHESIAEVWALFGLLWRAGYPVVAEHSEFPDAYRSESLRLFRSGVAQIIVSARSLIEGFNVPSADLGIVVAASSSVRQRVQTLGRLLRKGVKDGGREKQAELHVLYAHDTVDEFIYEKADWAQFIGAERNDYYVWRSVDAAPPEPRSEPPRVPLLGEDTVDAASLKPGDVYPGDPDQGRIYSIDTQGTLRDEGGHLLRPHAELKAILSAYPRSLGKFRITPGKHIVIKLEKSPEGWRGVYLGKLERPVALAEDESPEGAAPMQYSPGDIYPLAKVKGKTFSVLQRDKRLIANKSRSSVRFVVPAEELKDPRKQAALRQIQKQLAEVYSKGHRINKITVTDAGHVIYVFENMAYFVGDAPEGAEGFVFESRS